MIFAFFVLLFVLRFMLRFALCCALPCFKAQATMLKLSTIHSNKYSLAPFFSFRLSLRTCLSRFDFFHWVSLTQKLSTWGLSGQNLRAPEEGQLHFAVSPDCLLMRGFSRPSFAQGGGLNHMSHLRIKSCCTTS